MAEARIIDGRAIAADMRLLVAAAAVQLGHATNHAVGLGAIRAALLAADCTVTIVRSRSRDAAAICRAADILVAATGRPNLVGADWVKPGATVIDVGINPVTMPDG